MVTNWLDRNDRWLFPALAAAQCVPLLCIRAFPSVDGPAHLAISYMWAHSHDPAVWPSFSTVFEERPGLYPNLFCYVVLRVLLSFLDPLVAERLFVGLLVLAYPLAIRYAASRLGGDARLAAYFALPLAYNSTLFWGFYNFNWGLVTFVCFVGFMFQYRRQFSPKVVSLGLLITGFMYFAHVFAVGLSALAAALIGAGDLWGDLCSRRSDAWRRFVRMGLWAVVMLGAPLAVAAASLIRSTPTELSGNAVAVRIALEPVERISDLLAGSVLLNTPFSNVLLGSWVTLMVGVTLILFASYLDRKCAAVIALATGMVLLYTFIPSRMIARWLDLRLTGYVLSCAVLLVAAALVRGARQAPRVASACVATFVVLSLAGSVLRWTQIREIDAYLSEYRSAAAFIRAGSTVVSMRLVAERSDPEAVQMASAYLIQGGSYFAFQAQAIDAKLYQAQTAVVPIQFRQGRNPYRVWTTDLEFISSVPAPDLLSFDAAMGVPLDYVVVWGALDRATGNNSDRLKRQLAEGFRLVYRSTPAGLVHLYARRSALDERPAMGR